jgi:hypothetical protein
VADNMASSPVLNEARRVAAEFDLPAAQLNKGVQFFREQMKEGLEKQGSTLSQIPSFVTTVPDGSEKVRLGDFEKVILCISWLIYPVPSYREYIWLSIWAAPISESAQSSSTETRPFP